MVIVIIIFLTVALIGISIYTYTRNKNLLQTVTKLHRGTKTERDLILKLLKSGIPAQTIYHDLYLKKHKDKFSQIDLVVVTNVGILVFEVKDYSGWIFGTGHHQQWTQVLAYGKQKYRFYNPILQNKKHIEDLKMHPELENLPFYSIVVFYGDCTLKEINFVPNGTYLVKSNRVLEVFKIILKKNAIVNYHNKTEIEAILNSAVRNGEHRENQVKHINNVKDMLGKDRIFD